MYFWFDNRPAWYRGLWRASDLARRVICKMSQRFKYWLSQIIAVTLYWPIARTARLFELCGKKDVESFPLTFYRNKPLYMMRTDALDRFGTRLEQRFTKIEIVQMLEKAGLERLHFSDQIPFWVAVGYRKVEG